jgi:hypothetical protein
MNKEELEKEAEEWINKWELCNKCENKVDCISNFSYCKKVVLQSYLASAEPREKRIAELEEKVEQVLEDNNILQNENTMLKMDSKNNKVIYSCSTCRIKNNYKQSKELLNKMLAFITPNEFGDYPIIKESAEQFLSEVEK